MGPVSIDGKREDIIERDRDESIGDKVHLGV